MQTHSTLKSVEEGMKVFDRERHEIGKVEYVRFGDDDPDTPEVEAFDLSETDERNDSLLKDIAKAFASDDLPEELRERLLHQGYVRLDADGLFAADRYIVPEQIEPVSADGLMLNVTRDELIKQ
ncbi:hypothetical protein [Devosia sp.]|uniref:hypothetical protein n=1 Tax=Devosia sp. TaxID=1871048 RepID=UPI001ACE20DA|nr:hypothetical protein [Devosia sp.]MBN9310982.1 hypothetical protein [Devosia sp.]